MNILEEIILYKRLEVARRKVEVKVYDLEENPLYNSPVLSLKDALLDKSKNGIIAEFKRKSPSKGNINELADVETITRDYTASGASALSILTDEKFFNGSAADLGKARENNIPILRKDFIIDDYQVVETKAIGANAILLIASCLTPVELEYLATYAKTLDLEVLLEIHDESELNHICDPVDMIGVNSRNLKTFEVDIQQTIRLADKIPPGKIKVAESGIKTVDDVLLLRKHGFEGFLIGEKFMRAEDPGKELEEFVKELRKEERSNE